MSQSRTLPLQSLTVLDFTRIYSGPYTTLLLADMGADVIKVEHPCYGDDSRNYGPLAAGTSGYFETLNRGKRSIAIDYRSSEGQTVLRRIAQHVDVVIENFRPGQMTRYGLDYPNLSETCPRLVYVSISGFGQNGPYRDRGCYDVVAQAMSGLMSLTGLPELPIKTGPAIADAITGLTAAVGLLGALWQRERKGRGAYVDIAMLDSVFACLENTLAEYSVTGRVPVRQGNTDSVLAPFDCFQALDGWIAIGIGSERLWQSLAGLIDPALQSDSRFVSNAARVANYSILQPVLADWCRMQPVDVLLNRLQGAGVPSGPIRNIEELAHDPQLEARCMLATLPLDDGKSMLVPGTPIHVDGVYPLPIRRAPRLGEHTQEVLARFGIEYDRSGS